MENPYDITVDAWVSPHTARVLRDHPEFVACSRAAHRELGLDSNSGNKKIGEFRGVNICETTGVPLTGQEL